MLASLAFTLFVGFMSAIDDDFAILLLLPLLGFVIGLLTVFYGAFLADKRALKGAASQPQYAGATFPGQLGTPARSPELPASRMAPIESFPSKRGETAEMIQPPSVTENTTRLLDEESDQRH
jgi:hypothetical protein